MKPLEFLKKNREKITIAVLIFVVIAPLILKRDASNNDEIWVFSFIINVSNGLVPYRDFNMVPTPLLPLIAGTLLKFLGRELYVTRIMGAILTTAIFYTAYMILRSQKVHKIYSIFMLGIALYVYYGYVCLDYNFLALLFILIIIYKELRFFEKHEKLLVFDFKYDLFIGLLAGCCILSKQTTGICASIVAVGLRILQVRSKEDFICFIKIALVRCLGVLIPVSLFVIYMLVNGALYDFVDYTILGLKVFSNKKEYRYIIDFEKPVAVFGIIVPIFLIASLIYVFKTRNPKASIFTCYSIGAMVVVYPIADSIHFLVGAMPCFVYMIYLLYVWLDKIYEEQKDVSKGTRDLAKNAELCVLFLMTLIFGSSLYVLCVLPMVNDYKLVNHYDYIYYSDDEAKTIKNVGNYILDYDHDVYILDVYAERFFIPIDIYHKDLNLFQKGNTGEKGEDGIIEQIKNNDKEARYLISKDEDRNWQTPEKVIAYVIDNFEKVDEVEGFDVYQMKH